MSMCGLTAAQGLFTRLRLPSPFGKPAPLNKSLGAEPVSVFIYGASTSLGLYAAQLVRESARVSGLDLRLIGAASSGKHSFLRLQPYAYDALVDYRAASWAEDVKAATPGGRGIQYALDCISEGATVAKVHSTFADDVQGEGHFGVFRGTEGGAYDVHGLRVKPVYGAVWEGLGHEVGYNGESVHSLF